MEEVASGLRGHVAEANDGQLRTKLLAISDKYQVEVLAAKALVTAIQSGDEAAQSSAAAQLSAAALTGRNLASDLQDFFAASPQFASACPQP
jgi:hypothetical protein